MPAWHRRSSTMLHLVFNSHDTCDNHGTHLLIGCGFLLLGPLFLYFLSREAPFGPMCFDASCSIKQNRRLTPLKGLIPQTPALPGFFIPVIVTETGQTKLSRTLRTSIVSRAVIQAQVPFWSSRQ
ncbi:hypothetical protein BDV18DRAFT_4296 [Aspergillus unguis]